jgi:hypothetical protein
VVRAELLALLVALGAMALRAHTVSPDDKVVGVWRLQSWVMEDVETSETKAVPGEGLNGYLILTAQGRMMGLLPPQGRKGRQTEAADGSMLAYSGPYRVEGDKFITKVDVSWNQGWIGTEQTRGYKVDGTRLQILSPPQPNPRFGGKTMRGIFTFERGGE